MDTRRIVLVSESQFVPFADLAKVSSAVQRQVNDQFGPIWGVRAAIDPLASIADIPPNAWPVVIRDDIGISEAGVHWNETQDKPFALVTFREGDQPEEGWQPTVSHEILEMLADPFSKEFRTGPSLQTPQRLVEYLVEVCDPCQAPAFVYGVDDIPVSDFVLPEFYGGADAGIYSFRKNLTQPRQVLPGGYVSWRDLATGMWTQFLISNAGAEFRDLGTNPAPIGVHLRGFIDRQAKAHLAKSAKPGVRKKRKPRLARATAADIRLSHAAVRRAEGERWRRRIDSVLGLGGKS